MKSKEKKPRYLNVQEIGLSLESLFVPRDVKATKLEGTRPKLLAAYTEATGFARSGTFSG